MISKWMQKFAALSFAAMLLAVPGMPVHATADEDISTVAGLCSHHAQHTAECLSGTPCTTHIHTQDCYDETARCTHIHSDICGQKSTAYRQCTHVCSEDSGCITSVLNCHHEHDENCLYAKASTCSYLCDSCHASQSDSGQINNCHERQRQPHHGSRHSGRHH